MNNKIVIEKIGDSYHVDAGDKFSDKLYWHEMIGLVIRLTEPLEHECLSFLQEKTLFD